MSEPSSRVPQVKDVARRTEPLNPCRSRQVRKTHFTSLNSVAANPEQFDIPAMVNITAASAIAKS